MKQYLKNVKKEISRVRWPNKKELFTYTGVTLMFMTIFAVFFTISDVIIAGLRMVIK